MAPARRPLVETDLTVAELGRKVGYADPIYFARTFRRAHASTPFAVAAPAAPSHTQALPRSRGASALR
jgi:AraC-like DNA-binding protein